MTDTYSSLSDVIALSRVDALTLSPDGTRAVLSVSTLNGDATAYESALWEIPADGTGAPRRLTRSAKGESGAAFTSAGDLLFTSRRADASGDEPEATQVWMLPSRGGEARCISRLAGGVSGLAAVAVDAPVAILDAALMPSAASLEDDAQIRAARKKRKVSAILHSGYPIRDWDHDIGPDEPHLLALDLNDLQPEEARATASPNAETDGDDEAAEPYPGSLPRPRDLTPRPGLSADTGGVAITPDGTTVIAALRVSQGRGSRTRLVSIDVASGSHTVLADERDVDYENPTISRDGARLAYVRAEKSTPAGPADQEIWVSAVDGSDARRIASDWDRWPASMRFSADGSALIVTADHDGRCPIFSIDVSTGEVHRVTQDDAAYTSVAVDPAGAGWVALRSTMAEPPHPVRIAPDGAITALANPAPAPQVAAEVHDVFTTAEDGTRVRAWLLTPPDASAAAPAPLLLWIHGGPLNSWNAWSWRWNPALALARGYAVLLPDPALSTGYGLDFIARGWNSWGEKPFTDLMAITDEAASRPEIDGNRTAAMGGSFGGYMANWVAGHTDRFSAIVTHASLWAMDQFAGTTDFAEYWQSIFTPEAADQNSPHHAVASISTPMLVIHGDKDYRVPIGEGLRLWADLAQHFADEDGRMPHRFLYFPDENHWILKPQHSVIWYETVFAFLSEHVLGQKSELPDVLG